jgi:hypothetical protein
MFRAPFVWEVQVRREVLDDEMARLQALPYFIWRELLKRPVTKTLRGRDNREYRLKVTAEFVSRSSSDIQVTLALASAGLIRRGRIRQTFVITEGNTFRV